MPVYRRLRCDEIWKKSRRAEWGRACSRAIALSESLDRREEADLCEEAKEKARFVAKVEAFQSLAVVRCPESCRSMRVQISYDDPECSYEREPLAPELDLVRYCYRGTCRYHLRAKCHSGPWGAKPDSDPTAVPIPADGKIACGKHVVDKGDETAKGEATDEAEAERSAAELASDVAYIRAVQKLDGIQCPPECMFIKAQIDLSKPVTSTTSAQKQGVTMYTATSKVSWSLWAECTDQLGSL